ncbi:MAG TPA: prepilin-type N-terminal cleavage/methylation domain-containing protein [Candidatus Pacearchaeota archaeon]|nr:prepilin-type N-terminal cleavage/methylation domain-containing protein [Candidatus Pacearchaeota archaeon]
MTKHKSFTLIELLVVIVIIGILSGIIMISTSSSIDKASLAKSKVFSENIRNRMLLNLKMEFQFDSIQGTSAPYSTNDRWGNKNANLYYYSSIVSPFTIANSCSFSGTYFCPQLLEEKECIKGRCLNFNFGNHPFIELPSADQIEFDNGDSWTISSWIKLLTSSSVNYIGTRGTSNHLAIASDNSFQFRNSSGTIYNSPISSTKIRDKKWHLITWAANGNGNIFVYVDSMLETTFAVENNGFIFRNIGQSYTSSTSISGHFLGYMDELQIYNAAVSQAWIKKTYIDGLNSLHAKK